MAEPTTLNLPPTYGWRCVLCGQQVMGPAPSMHYCAAETRIREIIREELDKRAPIARGVDVYNQQHGTNFRDLGEHSQK
jgi:hypothetical protein